MDAPFPAEPDADRDESEDWATATDLFQLDSWIARHPAPAAPDASNPAEGTSDASGTARPRTERPPTTAP